MTEGDRLRIQVLQIESRLNDLTEEVIRGRTDMAEKMDRVAQKLDALTVVVMEMPKVIAEMLREIVKGASE